MKIDIFNQFDILIATTPTTMIEKAKMAKNILNKKVITIAISAISIAALYYNFYKQKNRKPKIGIYN